MYCNNCGRELKEGAKFCPNCGEKVIEDLPKSSEEKSVPDQPKVSAPAMQETPIRKQTGGRGLIITLAVLFIAVVIIVAAILFSGKQDKEIVPLSASEETIPLSASKERAAETAGETKAQPVRLSPEEVEYEVLAAREAWTNDRENILNNVYVSRSIEPEVTAYYDDQNNLVMVESTRDKAKDGFAGTYNYQNGKLIFAFYESEAEAYRLYYKDGAMFRLDKRTGGDPIVLDAAYEDPEFLHWERQGLTDGETFYNSASAMDLLSAPADKPAQLVDAGSVNTTGLYKLSYSGSGESSHIQQPKYDNTAKAAMDNDDTTSWQENVQGSGINEQVWYSFDRDYEFHYVALKLGNWRNDRYFIGNNRPRRLRITSGGYTASIEFPAEKKEYWIELPAWAGNQLSFTIEDAYRGNGEYDDTCIAEIGVYGK